MLLDGAFITEVSLWSEGSELFALCNELWCFARLKPVLCATHFEHQKKFNGQIRAYCVFISFELDRRVYWFSPNLILRPLELRSVQRVKLKLANTIYWSACHSACARDFTNCLSITWRTPFISAWLREHTSANWCCAKALRSPSLKR